MRLDQAAARLERAGELLHQLNAQAILLLGDLSHLGDLDSLSTGLSILCSNDAPVYMVVGNHDLPLPDGMARALREAGPGRVRVAGGRGYEPWPGVRIAGVPIVGRAGGTSAVVPAPPPVDSWSDDLVLLLSHYPAISLELRTEAAGFEHQWDVEQRDLLEKPLLGRNGPTVVLCGHQHVRDAFASGPVLQLAGAALVEPPAEVALLEVEIDARLTIRRTVVPVVRHEGERSPTLVGPVACYEYARSLRGWIDLSQSSGLAV
jgi:predicted phosphodiesterase